MFQTAWSGLRGVVAAMVVDASFPGLGESFLSGGSHRFALASMLLVWGDVSDGGVEPDVVVVVAADVEFGAEDVDVGDEVEVGELPFEVSEERLDPSLVGGGAGTSVVGGQPAQSHELSGRSRGHLGSVVRHDQQHRQTVVFGVVGDRPVATALLDRLGQSFVGQGPYEGGLDWIDVSSLEVTSPTHLREITSVMAVVADSEADQWVVS